MIKCKIWFCILIIENLVLVEGLPLRFCVCVDFVLERVVPLPVLMLCCELWSVEFKSLDCLSCLKFEVSWELSVSVSWKFTYIQIIEFELFVLILKSVFKIHLKLLVMHLIIQVTFIRLEEIFCKNIPWIWLMINLKSCRFYWPITYKIYIGTVRTDYLSQLETGHCDGDY